jgi:hypothetical protein
MGSVAAYAPGAKPPVRFRPFRSFSTERGAPVSQRTPSSNLAACGAS